MPAPQGTDLQFSWGFEKAENIWVPQANKHIRAKSVTGLVAKRGYERTGNMDPSGQTLKGIPVTAMITPKIDVDPDVDTLSPLLAHMCGKAPSISNPGGAAYQWLLTPREFSESAPATWQDSIFGVATDGDGNPILVSGARMNEFNLKISNGKLVNCSLGFMACYDSYQSDSTPLSGPATYTGKPIIRGHRASSAAGTLKLKVTAVAGGGFDGTAKFTLAAYAGGTTIQFKFDQWYRVVLDTGARAGISRFEDLWFCFPVSGVTTVAVNDEWSFTETLTLPSPSYSTLDPLNAAGVTVTIDGTEKTFHDADVKLVKPLKANMVIGSKYAAGIQKNGPWTAMVTLNRDRDDREFLTKLINASSAAVVVDLYGNPIAATGFDERLKINLPNGQVTDVQRDVTTPNTLQEKVDVMFHRSGSTDLFDLTIVNTLSAL